MTDPAGSNTQVQYNNDGVFGASPDFTWDDGSKALVVEGTIAGTDPSGDVFSMAEGTILLWAAEGDISYTGGRIVIGEDVQIYDDSGGYVIVSGGAFTGATTDGEAYFELDPSGNAAFGDSGGDNIVIESEYGSITVTATNQFTAIGGSTDHYLVISDFITKITDVQFEVDTGPLADTTLFNTFSLQYNPDAEPSSIAQVTLADAYSGQLVSTNGMPWIYDWRYNIGGTAGSAIKIGEQYSDDAYVGYLLLHAESDDDVAEEISLTPGSGTYIHCNKLGFFATTPVTQQTGPDYTATSDGGTFTDDDRDMLNAVYTALKAYGLLSV